MKNFTEQCKKYPVWGWAGMVLVAVFWPMNWFLPGTRSMYAFFPLWLGYILIVDGMVFLRSNTSQINRNVRGFVFLFCTSAPFWWLFEILNRRVQNWHYLGVENLNNIEYFLMATINFSVVIPAVFESSELASTFKWVKPIFINIRIQKSGRTAILSLLTGIIMLTVLLIWPKYFFPFMWLSIYFIVEPVNFWLGTSGLYNFLEKKDWRPVLCLFVGVLVTGFFWECWNYYSYPKWIYTVPYVNFAKIFEMPAPGYLGYLPFSLELCALFQFINGFSRIKNTGIIPVFERVFTESGQEPVKLEQ